ncbi:uncharacterized protein E5676_scaffold629G002010 [Cucumis melo var. makuwa]|uniref:Uncharacterized protein n=1 Tax=Cucumis melo var. makuwa TaxID=1194695 RepID=A0A5D3DYI5_CUCMM|nr:uncharacterized protein E6C27_scaffold274G005110 [Cucumis melo var. makuwa]TYK28554.1 uncharacterized protein E5676_scaffold629G002010 [Cucumis melo var. makuwa]
MDLLHSPPRLFTSEGRPARKYLGTSFSNYPKSEYHEVHEDEFNRPSPKDMSSNTPEHEASINSLGELIYHIDYHGVTTHPNPTPKHP